MWCSFLKNEVGSHVGFLCQAVAILKEHFVFSHSEGPCVSVPIPLGPVSSSAQLWLMISTRQTHLFQHLNEISILGCQPEKINAFIRWSGISLTVSKVACLFFLLLDLQRDMTDCVKQLNRVLPKGTWSRHWSRVMPTMLAKGFYLRQNKRGDTCSVPPKMMCHKEAEFVGVSLTGIVGVCMGNDVSTAALTWAMNHCSDILGVWLVPASTYCMSGPTSYPPVSKWGSPAWILLPNLMTPHQPAGDERWDVAIAERLISSGVVVPCNNNCRWQQDPAACGVGMKHWKWDLTSQGQDHVLHFTEVLFSMRGNSLCV